MTIVHGSSRCLARAVRHAGPFVRLRRGLKRFTTPMLHWKEASNVDWNRDLLLAYPDTVANAPENYNKLRDFYRGNKFEQWQILREFFRTPEVDQPPYVVRPLRHEGGQGFEITNTLPDQARSRTHYWRSLWERSCEYRVFYVHGKKALTLLKRVPEGTAQNIAWNAGVSSFVTVHNDEHDRLRHSKFYEKAEAFFAAYPFHLCAVDVLYRQHKHRVVEVNFSPGVLIPENKTTLVNLLLSRNDSRQVLPAPSTAPLVVSSRREAPDVHAPSASDRGPVRPAVAGTGRTYRFGFNTPLPVPRR